MRAGVFFTVLIVVLGGLHFYLWVRLVRDTGLAQPWRAIVSCALVLLAILIPFSFSLRHAKGAGNVLYWAAMIWLGLWFLFVMVLAATDVVRLLFWIGARATGKPRMDPARREWLKRTIGAGAAVVTGGLGTVAVASALGPVRVKKVDVKLAKLPKELDGTKIVQISDVHIGPTLGRRFLEDVVERMNAENPDVAVITGDLVDGSPREIGDAVSALQGIKAKWGVYFITGNHEYYTGAVEQWFDFLRGLGIRVLHNERVSIGDRDGASFDLAGVDDYSSHGLAPGHGQDIPKALAGRDPSRALVLLAHQPRAIREAAAHGVDLQLSGHTHGGQIWPWRYFVYLQQPFVAGLGKEKDTWIYVSKGTGFWGPPLRLFAPSEITRVTLRSV